MIRLQQNIGRSQLTDNDEKQRASSDDEQVLQLNVSMSNVLHVKCSDAGYRLGCKSAGVKSKQDQ